VTLKGTNFSSAESEKIIEIENNSSKTINFKIKIKDIGIF
jgi:hypothetical protein